MDHLRVPVDVLHLGDLGLRGRELRYPADHRERPSPPPHAIELPQLRRVDGVRALRQRADAVTDTTSRRAGRRENFHTDARQVERHVQAHGHEEAVHDHEGQKAKS